MIPFVVMLVAIALARGLGALGWAALALALLLFALFPANVHAARAHLTVAGRPATPLTIRLPLQRLWIGLLAWVAISRQA